SGDFIPRTVILASIPSRTSSSLDWMLDRAAVTMTSDCNLYVGFTADMSEGGLFVATHELLPIGEVVDLRIDLGDGGEPVEVEAEVRWLRPVEDASEDVMPGFGARFAADGSTEAQLVAGVGRIDSHCLGLSGRVRAMDSTR
ncbi:MAG: PilZ domain-containing protein, partial [Verrucomicrobiota bacterium]